MKKYQYKSVAGAVREIRRLERVLSWHQTALGFVVADRHTLARLACSPPEFYTPLGAARARRLRDEVMKSLVWGLTTKQREGLA